jgi:hypothetical protein
MQHRTGRDLDEGCAVVIGDELHARLQAAIVVDSLDFGLDARQHVVGVHRAVHHHDGEHHVVIMILARDSEPRHVADFDLGDVLYQHRDAVELGQNHVLDVLGPIALGQIVVAAAVHEAEAANIHRLLTDHDFAAADVDVRVAQGGNDLWNRDAVGIELVKIDVDIVSLGRTAPRIDLNDARHAEYSASRDPGLHGAQIGQPEMRRTDDLVAIDFADRARHLDLRNLILRQRDVLLEVQTRLHEGGVVIDAVFEGDAHEGQTVKRGRPDVVDTCGGIEADLHRDGVGALHLLGGQTRGLGGDFEDHRRRIRIGLDVQLRERNDSRAEEYQQSQQDDGTAGQAERKNSLQHTAPPVVPCA